MSLHSLAVIFPCLFFCANKLQPVIHIPIHITFDKLSPFWNIIRADRWCSWFFSHYRITKMNIRMNKLLRFWCRQGKCPQLSTGELWVMSGESGLVLRIRKVRVWLACCPFTTYLFTNYIFVQRLMQSGRTPLPSFPKKKQGMAKTVYVVQAQWDFVSLLAGLWCLWIAWKTKIRAAA